MSSESFWSTLGSVFNRKNSAAEKDTPESELESLDSKILKYSREGIGYWPTDKDLRKTPLKSPDVSLRTTPPLRKSPLRRT